MSETFLAKLQSIVASNDILENEPMKKHTTFQVGGPARYFVSPRDVDVLRNVIFLCQKEMAQFVNNDNNTKH